MTPGTVIDNHYKLKELIGRGSFGEVWLATDTDLEQDVALKFYVAMDKLIVSDVANGERTELNVDVARVYIVKVGNTVKRVMVE